MSIEGSLWYDTYHGQVQSRDVKLVGTWEETDEGVVCYLEEKKVYIGEKWEFNLVDPKDGINKRVRVSDYPRGKGVVQKVNLSLIKVLDILYRDQELVYTWDKVSSPGGIYYRYDWRPPKTKESQNILINPRDNSTIITDPIDGKTKLVKILWERINKDTWEVVNTREIWTWDVLEWVEFQVHKVIGRNVSNIGDNYGDIGVKDRDSQPY